MGIAHRTAHRIADRQGGGAALGVVFALWAALASGPSLADEPLAPAGPCAESRRTAVSPDPDPGYAVAGVPAGRFTAASVSNPGRSPRLAPPPSSTGPQFQGVGPCETRGSGCNPTSPSSPPDRIGPSVSPYVPPKR
jgi:hypothetical protein